MLVSDPGVNGIAFIYAQVEFCTGLLRCMWMLLIVEHDRVV